MNKFSGEMGYQQRMFDIDETGEFTYLIERENPELEIDPLGLQNEYTTLGFYDPVAPKREFKSEKEDERTILLTISDLEKIRKILTAIPQFQELAANLNMDLDSIEFLEYCVQSIDFMSLPHFDIDMSMFDLLPKNDYIKRESMFNKLLLLVEEVSVNNKLPTRLRVIRLFGIDDESSLDSIYALLKYILGLLNSWGGMQVHLFEQLTRTWLYVAYEKGGKISDEDLILLLKTQYPCKADFEILMYANLIRDSISFKIDYWDFVEFFFKFLDSFNAEENSFLLVREVQALWSSEYLRVRIRAVADRWCKRMQESGVTNPENELDSFFGISRRLSRRSAERVLPPEIAQIGRNETLIKLKLYFEQGHRALIEARLDRFISDPNTSIFDWKTSRKTIEDLGDFEKLQLVLQSIALQQLLNVGSKASPITNNDYKFYLVSGSQQYVNYGTLPMFYYLPEKSDCVFDYVPLEIDEDEARRLLKGLSTIVEFLIINKGVFAAIRRHLKNIDGYITAPKLAPLEELTQMVTNSQYAYVTEQ